MDDADANQQRHRPSRDAAAASPGRHAAGQLTRAQLVQTMMDAGAARLVLVRAPAGFGKTTLLKQYQAAAQAAGRDTVWLDLEPADCDIHGFVARVRAAFDSMCEQAGVRYGDATGHIRMGAGEDVDAPGLAARIAAYARPFALILDEFEALQGTPVLNYVQHLLDVLPAHGTVVIASRVTPDLGLGRIRVRGQLLEIGPAALRFTLEEAAAYLRDNQHLPLSDADIATLHQCTEGWAAAIWLASLSLQTRTDHAAFVSSFSGSNFELAQYLAEDILARLDVPVRAFLLDTSVLDELSGPLCDALTGRADSLAMIEELERANLFLFRLDQDGSWYRYHNLFASFLRGRLEREQPGRAASLQRAAAAWYEQAGRPVPAVEHLLRAGAHDEAAAAIAQCVQTLQAAGRFRLLVRWFDLLAPAVLARHPQLGLAYAWALVFHRRFDDATRAIAGVREALQGDAGESVRLEAESIRCTILALTDRMEACCEAGIAQLERLPREQTFQYRVVTNALSYAMLSTCRYDDARQTLSRALQRDVPLRSTTMRAIADGAESIIDLLQGRLGNALGRLQALSARQPDPLQMEMAGGRTSVGVLLAWALYEGDRRDEAARALADALPYAKSTASNDTLIVSHVLMARFAQLRGDAALCQRVLVDLEQVGRDNAVPRVVCSAWLERARIATVEGRLDAAADALRNADLAGDWVRPGVSFYANDVDTPWIARARLAIAQGDCAALPDALPDAIAAALAQRRRRCALKLQVLLALCYARLAREDDALGVLTEALREAGHEGFVRLLLDEGEPLGQLMQRWAARYTDASSPAGVDAHFVANLLERFGLNPVADALRTPSHGVPVEAAPATPGGRLDALSARELDVLRLLALGLRNRVIAEKLFVSETTVKFHLRNINAKLGAHARTEAIAIARRRGLLD